MTPVILAALALAGAPSGTTVTCDPSLAYMGLTTYGYNTPPSIALYPLVCQGIKATTARGALSDYQLYLIGLGSMVLLHEASHASGIYDETDAQCAAMRLVPRLLARFLSARNARLALAHAREDNRAMPTEYRAHPCA